MPNETIIQDPPSDFGIRLMENAPDIQKRILEEIRKVNERTGKI